MAGQNTIPQLDANLAREIFTDLQGQGGWDQLLRDLARGKYGPKGVAFARSVQQCLDGDNNPLLNIAKNEGGPIAICPDKAKTKLRVIIVRGPDGRIKLVGIAHDANKENALIQEAKGDIQKQGPERCSSVLGRRQPANVNPNVPLLIASAKLFANMLAQQQPNAATPEMAKEMAASQAIENVARTANTETMAVERTVKNVANKEISTKATQAATQKGTQTYAIIEQPQNIQYRIPGNNIAAVDPVLATALIAPLAARNLKKFSIQAAKDTADGSLRNFLPQNTVNKIMHKQIEQMPWYKNWAGPMTTGAFILADSHPIETYQQLGTAAARDKLMTKTIDTAIALGSFHAAKAVATPVVKAGISATNAAVRSWLIKKGVLSAGAAVTKTATPWITGAFGTMMIPVMLATQYGLHQLDKTEKSIDKKLAYAQNLALECKDPFAERVMRGNSKFELDDSFKFFTGLFSRSYLKETSKPAIDAIIEDSPSFMPSSMRDKQLTERYLLNHLNTNAQTFEQRMGMSPRQYIDAQKEQYLSSLTQENRTFLQRQLDDYYNRHPQINKKATIEDLMTFRACMTVPDEFREDYIANNRDNSALTKDQLLSALGSDVFSLSTGARRPLSPEEFEHWTGKTVSEYTGQDGANLSSAYSKMTDPGLFGGDSKRKQKTEVITTLHELAVNRGIPLITEEDFEKAFGMKVEDCIDQCSKTLKATNPNIKDEDLHACAIVAITQAPLDNVVFNEADRKRQSEIAHERENLKAEQIKKEEDLLLAYSGLSREEFVNQTGGSPEDVLNISVVETIEMAAKNNPQIAQIMATDEGKTELFVAFKQKMLNQMQDELKTRQPEKEKKTEADIASKQGSHLKATLNDLQKLVSTKQPPKEKEKQNKEIKVLPQRERRE